MPVVVVGVVAVVVVVDAVLAGVVVDVVGPVQQACATRPDLLNDFSRNRSTGDEGHVVTLQFASFVRVFLTSLTSRTDGLSSVVSTAVRF